MKNPPANAGYVGDTGSIPGSGRSPGGGPGNPLQYSCLENPMDRGAWWATVHGVPQSWTCPKRLSMHTHLKLTQLYKSTILQLKIFLNKKQSTQIREDITGMEKKCSSVEKEVREFSGTY